MYIKCLEQGPAHSKYLLLTIIITWLDYFKIKGDSTFISTFYYFIHSNSKDPTVIQHTLNASMCQVQAKRILTAYFWQFWVPPLQRPEPWADLYAGSIPWKILWFISSLVHCWCCSKFYIFQPRASENRGKSSGWFSLREIWQGRKVKQGGFAAVFVFCSGGCLSASRLYLHWNTLCSLLLTPLLF